MIEGAWAILRHDRLRCTNLHINYSQIMTEAVVYLSRQTVPFLGGSQIFNLCGVFTQSLVSLCQFGAGLALARRDSREDDYENYPGTVNDCDDNRIDPSTAQN